METMNLRTDKGSQIGSSSWIENYYDKIYPVILRMVANEEVAKDLTQEAFLRAWEKRSSFRGDSNLGTWLYRIAVNVTLTYLGKNKKVSQHPIEESILPDKREGIHKKLERMNECDLVRQAIQDLPPAYRITVIMHYYEDKKLDQIAKLTGISKGTAAWRLYKARNMLNKNLRAMGVFSEV